MRHVQIRVGDAELETLTRTLEEKGIDYVVLAGTGPTADYAVVEFPLPTDAVGDVLRAVDEAGIDEEAYTVIGSAEAAMTPGAETLQDRYASDFDPLSRPELRSKARDMSRDWASYVALISLSAVIATAGLLAGSPAVIVGSMVIAPFVGPVLTAGVGTVTDDRAMVVDSFVMQGAGVVVAIAWAAAFSLALRSTSLVSPNLAITSIDAIASRTAPNALTVAVGLAAGAAAAYALATKGPTALIGVMIAAALIPTAATAGIGLVWGYPLLTLGTVLLLVVTVLAINVGVLVVLWTLGYRPTSPLADQPRDGVPSTAVLVTGLLVFGVVGGAVGVATYEHVRFERSINVAVNDVLDQEPYADVGVVGVQPQYGGPSPFPNQRGVTVVLATSADAAHPRLADRLARRIAAATDDDVQVTVRFVDYENPTADRQGAVARPDGRRDAAGSPARAGSSGRRSPSAAATARP